MKTPTKDLVGKVELSMADWSVVVGVLQTMIDLGVNPKHDLSRIQREIDLQIQTEILRLVSEEMRRAD